MASTSALCSGTRSVSTNGQAESGSHGDVPLLQIRMARRPATQDNARQMADTPTLEQFAALQQALAEALKHNESWRASCA